MKRSWLDYNFAISCCREERKRRRIECIGLKARGIIRAGYRLQILHFYKAPGVYAFLAPLVVYHLVSSFFSPLCPPTSFVMTEVAANDDSFIAKNKVVEEPKKFCANQPRSIRQEGKSQHSGMRTSILSCCRSCSRPGFSNEVDGKMSGWWARKCLKNTRCQRYRRKLGSFESILFAFESSRDKRDIFFGTARLSSRPLLPPLILLADTHLLTRRLISLARLELIRRYLR